MTSYGKVSFDSSMVKPAPFIAQFLYFRDGENELSVSSFKQIISKLDFYEKISLLFLLIDNAKTSLDMIKKLEFDPSYDPITSWFCLVDEKSLKNKEILLLEALALIQNYEVAQELGFSKFDLLNVFRQHFQYKTLLLNPIRKLLFKLCENIAMDDAENLIESIEEDSEKLLGSKLVYSPKFLEVFFLRWISLGYISIENSIDLSKLNHSLRKLNLIKEADYLEYGIREISTFMQSDKSTSLVEGDISDESHEETESYYKIIDPHNVGVCVIINQQDFSRSGTSIGTLVLPDRNGSEADCKELQTVLTNLKFKVVILNNLPSGEIIPSLKGTIVKNFKKDIHSILVLVILSHGTEGTIYGVDGDCTPIKQISSSLNISPLLGKPKVVIIQACQGKKFYQSPNDPALAFDGISPEDIESGVGDLLVCVATVPGFKAFRHKENGSWYIQALCKLLKENPEQDIHTLITRVNKELSKQELLLCGKKVTMRSEFTSCFSNNLYFKPKKFK